MNAADSPFSVCTHFEKMCIARYNGSLFFEGDGAS